MNDKGAGPRLYIIAGVNGSGKTTFARELLPNYVECLEFVNADLIAGGLSPFSPGAAALRAGRLVLEQIESLSSRKRDFGFETTLSGRSYLPLLRSLRKTGYRIHLFYLWIPRVDLALARIADRVKRGGHTVPENVVRRRFRRSLRNFFRLYEPLLDSWTIFDNSGESPRMIAFKKLDKLQIIYPHLYAIISKRKEAQ